MTTINALRKHSNADRLQCITVFGNNVIVDLSYTVGQRIVFFPTDGQLSQEFAIENNLVRVKDENGNNIGGYLDPHKRKIGAMTLRGEKSEGLVLPLETLSKYVDISTLKDGEQINVLNGTEICKKYIPVVTNGARAEHSNKSKSKNTKKVQYPLFKEHIDTSQLAYNQAAFRVGDICYITLKMHGTSMRTTNTIEVKKKKRPKLLKLIGFKDSINKSYKVVSGTRRVVLDTFGEGGWHGSNAFREKYHEMLKSRLPKGMTVYYEVVGWVDKNKTIMGVALNKKTKDKDFIRKYGEKTVFSYGCKQGESDCYAYRITFMNEDGVTIELPTEQAQIWCEMLGIKHVPVFEKFIYTSWEDLMERVEKYYDGEDPIGRTHVREGIVVRIDNRDKFSAFKHKNFHFKVLEDIIKVDAEEPDMEEVQELEHE